MMFNFPAYGQALLAEFFARGGRHVARNFYSPAEIASLPEPAVIDATGYAARDLWGDASVIPVRGQTGWLVPQGGVNYGLRFNNMSVLSKADGMVVMNNNPDLGDMLGVGDSIELPSRARIEEAMARLAGLFAAPAAGPAA
jgi:hypothetical protein